MEFSTKTNDELTLHDRLSRLTFRQAVQLLGEEGEKRIQKGGAWDIDINEQVVLNTKYIALNCLSQRVGKRARRPRP